MLRMMTMIGFSGCCYEMVVHFQTRTLSPTILQVVWMEGRGGNFLPRLFGEGSTVRGLTGRGCHFAFVLLAQFAPPRSLVESPERDSIQASLPGGRQTGRVTRGCPRYPSRSHSICKEAFFGGKPLASLFQQRGDVHPFI